MSTSFNEAYLKLNKDQLKAVEYIDGPLLVIAGPGTGKTQLLSLRAANILIKTDSLPENILCLTFTEAGVEAMRERLIRFIGQDAYKITISTYHGFASELIRRYPQYFLQFQYKRPISALRIDHIVRDIQKSLPFNNELKSPELVGSLIGTFSSFKQALLTPEAIDRVAKYNLSFTKDMSAKTTELTSDLRRVSLKSNPAFERLLKVVKASKLPNNIEPLSAIWQRELNASIEEANTSQKATSLSRFKLKFLAKNEHDQLIVKGEVVNKRLQSLSQLYKDYLKQLDTNQLLDYDDLILKAIEALKNHDELRFNLQERYLYIMLDEYQDTNKAQSELVNLLTNNPASEGRPNVMAVGDDDQAIYAFQGAMHSNMLDFINSYNNVKQITLNTNYRSSQNLINLSTAVANQIDERLTKLEGINKDFIADSKSPAKLNYLNFNSEIESYSWLASQLKYSKYANVAVISPEHKYLERAAAYLTKSKVSFAYERRENILYDPFILQLINLLRLVHALAKDNQKQADYLIPIVLSYDFWQLKIEEVWELNWQAHEKHMPLIKVTLKSPKFKNTASMLLRLASNSLSLRFDQLIDQATGLSDLSEHNLKGVLRSPFWTYYELDKNDAVAAKLFENLSTLTDYFKDYYLGTDHALTLATLINFIDQLEASSVKLTNSYTANLDDDSVQLMTVHGSKGREFDYVYLLNFINEAWGPKLRRGNRLSLPPNLEFIRYRNLDSDDERLRSLYVAISRAKRNLTTLSYSQDFKAKRVLPLKYLELPSKDASSPSNTSLQPLWQGELANLDIKENFKKLIQTRLKDYALSPTELNTFLDIRNAGPEVFYKTALLKHRQPSSPRLDYGSAIHDSLNWLQNQLNLRGRLPSFERLSNQFIMFLIQRQLLEYDFKPLKDQGINSLKAYYQEYRNDFRAGDLSEYSFYSEHLTLGPVRLNGKIDKLKIDDKSKSLTIIDYKTGQGQSRWENKPKVHLYKHQLYFYKLLVESSSKFNKYKVEGAQLDFVEPDNLNNKFHRLELTYNLEEAQRFNKLLTAVWQHILDLNFPNVDAYPETLKGIISFEEDLINNMI